MPNYRSVICQVTNFLSEPNTNGQNSQELSQTPQPAKEKIAGGVLNGLIPKSPFKQSVPKQMIERMNTSVTKKLQLSDLRSPIPTRGIQITPRARPIAPLNDTPITGARLIAANLQAINSQGLEDTNSNGNSRRSLSFADDTPDGEIAKKKKVKLDKDYSPFGGASWEPDRKRSLLGDDDQNLSSRTQLFVDANMQFFNRNDEIGFPCQFGANGIGRKNRKGEEPIRVPERNLQR